MVGSGVKFRCKGQVSGSGVRVGCEGYTVFLLTTFLDLTRLRLVSFVMRT